MYIYIRIYTYVLYCFGWLIDLRFCGARKILRHRTADESANQNNTGHTYIYVSACDRGDPHRVTKGTYRAVCETIVTQRPGAARYSSLRQVNHS